MKRVRAAGRPHRTCQPPRSMVYRQAPLISAHVFARVTHCQVKNDHSPLFSCEKLTSAPPSLRKFVPVYSFLLTNANPIRKVQSAVRSIPSSHFYLCHQFKRSLLQKVVAHCVMRNLTESKSLVRIPSSTGCRGMVLRLLRVGSHQRPPNSSCLKRKRCPKYPPIARRDVLCHDLAQDRPLTHVILLSCNEAKVAVSHLTRRMKWLVAVSAIMQLTSYHLVAQPVGYPGC